MIQTKPADATITGYCGNSEIHPPHGMCGGLVPNDWEQFPCANPACDRMVWLPPGLAAPDVPNVRVCSTSCLSAMIV